MGYCQQQALPLHQLLTRLQSEPVYAARVFFPPKVVHGSRSP
ncbi:MAG: hypothetical protein ACYC9Q_12080 [Bacillota bacterium]